MAIKSILFGILTVVTFIGCTKTSQPTSTAKPDKVIEKEVQFQVDGADVEMRMIVNSEELEDLPAGMMQYVMQMIDGQDSSDDQWELEKQLKVDGSDVEMRMIVNGEELEDLPADMMQYVMQMVDSHDSFDDQWELEKQLAELQVDFEDHHDEMDDFQREEMRLEMEHLRRELDSMNYQDFSEVWQHDDPYIEQGSDFIEKILLSEEIANVLSDQRSVSIFCIWEARQHLEPQERIEALFPIMINNQVDMAVRNAAAMVVRQSFYETGNRARAIETLRNQIFINSVDIAPDVMLDKVN